MPICPICSKLGEFAVSPFKNHGRNAHYIFEGIKRASCAHCASSWAVNPPKPDQLQDYYSNNYGGAVRQKPVPIVKKEWPRLDTRATSLITLGRLFCCFSPSDVFFDIGPGMHGTALATAKYMLPKPVLACVEYNDRAISNFRANIPDVIVGASVRAILDKFGPGGVKFIYSAHCFEHFSIDELRGTLAMLRTMLADDGVLSVEVPHASTKTIRGNVPHLIFFSSSGLRAFLESAGFEVHVCVDTLGRTKSGDAYVTEQLQNDDTGLSEAFVQHVKALNVGDWIGYRPGLVIKCVATKAKDWSRETVDTHAECRKRLRARDWVGAIDLSMSALTRSPGAKEHMLSAAAALSKLGRLEEAGRLLKRARHLRPRDRRLRWQHRWLNSPLTNSSDAKMAQHVVSLFCENRNILWPVTNLWSSSTGC